MIEYVRKVYFTKWTYLGASQPSCLKLIYAQPRSINSCWCLQLDKRDFFLPLFFLQTVTCQNGNCSLTDRSSSIMNSSCIVGDEEGADIHLFVTLTCQFS